MAGTSERVAVVGGGIFGCTSALRLAAAGYSVTLFERLGAIMRGASLNNQNRLHLGFHYPRSPKTIVQCARGFHRFTNEFVGCVVERGVNAYFVMSEGSVTSPVDYLSMMRRMKLPFTPIAAADFAAEFEVRVGNVDCGLLCDERVFDARALGRELQARLDAAGVEVKLGVDVQAITRKQDGGFVLTYDRARHAPFAAVVNCTFGDVNRFTRQLGHEVRSLRYEYTAQLILECDLPRVSVTIMDSPVRGVSLLPFGRSDQFLLYHARLARIAFNDDDQLDHAWLDPVTAPFARRDVRAWTAEMIEACSYFLPDLARARVVGFLEGPRMIPAGGSDTDARPSFVTQHEPGYLTVHAGKIDHCLEAADEVLRLVSRGSKSS